MQWTRADILYWRNTMYNKNEVHDSYLCFLIWSAWQEAVTAVQHKCYCEATKFRARLISSISTLRLGAEENPVLDLLCTGRRGKWGPRLFTHQYFSVTLPESPVKLYKPKLEMFQRTSDTTGKGGIILMNISQKESMFNCFPSLISWVIFSKIIIIIKKILFHLLKL